MAKKTITEEMRKELRADFPEEAYSAIPHKPGFTTLKAIYVTERLNNIFGIGRWTIEPEIIERSTDYVLIQGEFISLDFEVKIPKQFGGHRTTGKGVEIADGFKSALTDCQSKIASYLEIGIEMFKGKIQVPGNITQKPAYTKPEYTKPQKKIAPKKLIKLHLKEDSKQFTQAVEALASNRAEMDDLRKYLVIDPMMEKLLHKCATDLVAEEYFKEQMQRQG